MIRQYTEQFYLPAHADHQILIADGAALAKSHAAMKKRIRAAWPSVRIEMLESKLPTEIPTGESVLFSARVQTGLLTPEDLRVELYAGPLNSSGDIVRATITEMQPVRQETDGYLYEVTTVPYRGSGSHGYTARVLPRHPDLKHPFAFGLITWAS
jgi:starch phosphorylase